VRPEAELRRRGLADEDRSRRTHPLDEDRIGLGDRVLEDRRPLRGGQALHGREVLDGLREAVHPPPGVATGDLLVPSPRLLQELASLADQHDGVDVRVRALDVVEVGCHDFDARERAHADGPREILAVHAHDLGA
jgi:hypothetical protein